MFDSLDDQMKADDSKAVSSTMRIVPYLIGVVLTILVLGGLYYVYTLLEGT